ncbi:MAG: uracil-DNA glycosylase [Proteobacteria bacterium]|nr:uracil-DNA glycosylase [Pseudomonadota bacterium]
MVLEELWQMICGRIFPRASTEDLFNQYADFDRRIDLPEAPAIRRNNLGSYLQTFCRKPDILLVGEAAGPWGCRFSGVPFTGEQQLLAYPRFPFSGEQSSRNDPPTEALRRGNRPPYISQSAKAFWEVLERYYADPAFLVWDLVPLHPHEENRLLSVRTPTRTEVRLFSSILAEVVRIVSPKTIIAVGRKAERALHLVGVHSAYVRHPARGGKAEFETGIRRILGV